jgi:hypothetical protein
MSLLLIHVKDRDEVEEETEEVEQESEEAEVENLPVKAVETPRAELERQKFRPKFHVQ